MSVDKRKKIDIQPNPIVDVLELVTDPGLFLLKNIPYIRYTVKKDIKTVLNLSDLGYGPGTSFLIGIFDTIGSFIGDKYNI